MALPTNSHKRLLTLQYSENDTSVTSVICSASTHKLLLVFLMQVEASNTLKHVSASLLSVNTEHNRDGQELKEAANYLFNAVSNVLKASVEIRAGNTSGPEAEQVI